MQIKLTDLDFRILKILMNDSHMSLTSISKELLRDKTLDKQIPKSTIHSRIKRLEEKNVIDKYTLKLNYKLLNFPLLAFIMLNFDQHKTDKDQEVIARELASYSMVDEVHIIAGEWDIICKVRAEDIDELGNFSVKVLKKIDGIGKSLTYVVLKQIKDHSTAPYVIE